MERFVALYRGINVGGRNPVKMDGLRAMHERLGHRAVESYIQSGNIVFSGKGPAATIARMIAAEFARSFGFAARVIVVPGAAWGGAVRRNPYAGFSAERPKTVHAGFCEGTPSVKGLEDLRQRTGGTEEFVVAGGVVYLHAPDGFGTSKFAAGMEKACGVPMTVRNWCTVEEIAEMIKGGDPR
ncbi:MAG: DUF1697 domain-containing protein [Phycisphaerales bacterium]|nr:DUF1697 domain-containing protein [Phycisphaerales bacterium]